MFIFYISSVNNIKTLVLINYLLFIIIIMVEADRKCQVAELDRAAALAGCTARWSDRRLPPGGAGTGRPGHTAAQTYGHGHRSQGFKGVYT